VCYWVACKQQCAILGAANTTRYVFFFINVIIFDGDNINIFLNHNLVWITNDKLIFILVQKYTGKLKKKWSNNLCELIFLLSLAGHASSMAGWRRCKKKNFFKFLTWLVDDCTKVLGSERLYSFRNKFETFSRKRAFLLDAPPTMSPAFSPQPRPLQTIWRYIVVSILTLSTKSTGISVIKAILWMK